jgi:hypothetical protein
MTATTHKGYGTIVSCLTTELNSLANNANTTASSAIDNSTNLDLYGDFELVIGTTSARTAGAVVQVFFAVSADGTNYADVNETTAELACTFSLDAATTARRAVVRDVPLPPGLFKVFARNVTGQALNASGNTVKFRPHSLLNT